MFHMKQKTKKQDIKMFHMKHFSKIKIENKVFYWKIENYLKNIS